MEAHRLEYLVRYLCQLIPAKNGRFFASWPSHGLFSGFCTILHLIPESGLETTFRSFTPKSVPEIKYAPIKSTFNAPIENPPRSVSSDLWLFCVCQIANFAFQNLHNNFLNRHAVRFSVNFSTKTLRNNHAQTIFKRKPLTCNFQVSQSTILSFSSKYCLKIKIVYLNRVDAIFDQKAYEINCARDDSTY